MPGNNTYFVLSGDIGGTNSRFNLIRVDEATLTLPEGEGVQQQPLVFTQRYKNAGYEAFHDVLGQFVRDCQSEVEGFSRIDVGCLAVAGPVKNNAVKVTQLGWSFCSSDLEKIFNIAHMRIINDFEANGYGVLALRRDQLEEIRAGKVDPDKPIAVIGAGTGLGECFLTKHDGEYVAWPCEGGHVDFAPRTDLETELLTFLRHKFNGRVSVERVVSGKGLVNTYEFLAQRYPDKVKQRFHDEIMASREGGALISKYAYDYDLARQTIDIFMSAYGSETGNLKLKLLPFGGVYVAGGIAPKNLAFMYEEEGNHFIPAMEDKGRIAPILSTIPVRVITTEELGLTGAHIVAVRALRHHLASQGGAAVSAIPATRSPAPAQQAPKAAASLEVKDLVVVALVAGLAAVVAERLFRKL